MPNQPYLNEHKATTTTLTVIVRNRERIFFDGPAQAVTAYNSSGKFDILPAHVNFISIIKTAIIIYKPDGTSKEFKISTGIMKVTMNTIQIYLGILTQAPTSASTKA